MTRRPRLRIRWVMAASVPIAILLGVFHTPLDPVALMLFLVPVWLFFMFAWYVGLVVLPWTLLVNRRACPACGRRTLACIAVSIVRPPLGSTHRCRSCDATMANRPGRGWCRVTGADNVGHPEVHRHGPPERSP